MDGHAIHVTVSNLIWVTHLGKATPTLETHVPAIGVDLSLPRREREASGCKTKVVELQKFRRFRVGELAAVFGIVQLFIAS